MLIIPNEYRALSYHVKLLIEWSIVMIINPHNATDKIDAVNTNNIRRNLFISCIISGLFMAHPDFVPKDQSVILLPTKLLFSLIKPSVGE